MSGITVGFDGSDCSHRALEWAMREATTHQAPLTVVAVHEVAANHWTGHPMLVPEDRADEERIRQAIEEAVAKMASQLGESAPGSVSVRVQSGIAAEVLIGESQNADLVVVGTRGGGGFARLITGSVSNQVVNHAACPVTVVR